MSAVLPTKSNLMQARRSRALALTGYELMDRKRSILVRELMALLETAQDLQSQIGTVFAEAYDALARANISLGVCAQIARAVPIDDTLTVQYRSVMGVEIPHIPGASPPPRLEYGFDQTDSALDDYYLKFHKVKDLVRQMAEVENSIYRLAEAVKKARKRANALKHIVIPGFDETIRTITGALEEKEREEFTRLKVMKGRTL